MQRAPRKETVIGMIIEDIDTDFAKELVMNCANAIPRNRNIRFIVFPGKYDSAADEPMYKYTALSNSIYRLAEDADIDGLIIHLGSMTARTHEPVFIRLLDRLRDVPKVFIGLDSDELITVNYDNESGIREAVDHLVEVEGVTRFCMLGGRADNEDAQKRREIFIKCLERNRIPFEERSFIYTDMTENCLREAETLLDRNYGVQAVFCVNDASAKALYAVMEERRLVPGEDIYVFGFDNTHMATELKPTLASIGSDESSLGQKAMETVLSLIGGEDTGSALVPTRFFGRDSLPYEMYDYTVLEMLNVDEAFIYRMFDDCFYRYRSAYHDHSMVDLRRLFYEIISNMLISLKERYMSFAAHDRLCD
ncbi:MAG: LacI family DNA-binding transcriptional regulator, partial [Oscillospiraceae bacterium]|nr:LacI family DNA-binding transcriptional regulator [Oscillospiraceae bacterium]